MKKLFLISFILVFILFSCTTQKALNTVSAEKTAESVVIKEDNTIEIKKTSEEIPLNENKAVEETTLETNEIPYAIEEVKEIREVEEDPFEHKDEMSTVDLFSYAYGVSTADDILLSSITFNSLYFVRGIYDAFLSPLSPSLSSLNEVNAVIEEYINGDETPLIDFGPRPDMASIKTLTRESDFSLLFSYSYGFSVMQSIKFAGLDISIELFIEGILDAVYLEEPKLSDDELNAAIDNYITFLNEEYYLSLESEMEEKENKAEEFLEKNRKEDGVITLDSGVQLLFLEKADESGRTPTQYDTVIMDYNEYVLDYDTGELEFRDVVRESEVHVFDLSNALQSAIVRMHTGDAVRVFIPPELSDKYELDEKGLLFVYDIALNLIL